MFPVIRNSFLTQRVNLISDSFSLWKARRVNRGGYATPFLKRRNTGKRKRSLPCHEHNPIPWGIMLWGFRYHSTKIFTLTQFAKVQYVGIFFSNLCAKIFGHMSMQRSETLSEITK
ncbi:hypothetical protein KP509_09G081100 [Ceratopteris richardii]|uniref:Uncharacterized protein n=1 Tax=Ceratopteris richardii TaxID=49495 RepID=A0A8T2U695_CERRI|nr:hypothetical protein KP509_09G081100 [Ceratopteris richardii]